MQLIDRYKFLELYPCSAEELKLLGHPGALAKAPLASTLISANANGVSAAAPLFSATDLDTMPKPDFSQMLPFKVRMSRLGK